MDFKSFNSARRTLRGIEAMNTIKKGQVKGIEQGDSVSQGLLNPSLELLLREMQIISIVCP